jgi:hypothetical protein
MSRRVGANFVNEMVWILDAMWTLAFKCEPEVSLSQEDSRQNGEACNLQIARPERFERTCGGRVEARGRPLTGRPSMVAS